MGVFKIHRLQSTFLKIKMLQYKFGKLLNAIKKENKDAFLMGDSLFVNENIKIF